jgi:hypothetical protein
LILPHIGEKIHVKSVINSNGVQVAIYKVKSKCNLEGMMVNIFIDIVGLKCIIGMIKCEFLRQKVCAIHRNKMGSMIDHVNMNNGVLWGIVCSKSWMNHPHSCIFIGSIIDFVEPADHSARVHFALVLE